jgi:hypothetical protein
MPKVGDMYPSRYISFRDFPRGELQVGTIQAVEPDPYERVRPRRIGAAELHDWVVWFHEFAKPMKLPPERLERFARVLGEEDTDKWPGMRIGFFRDAFKGEGDEIVEGLFIDGKLPPKPKAAVLVPSSLLDATKAGSVLSAATVDRFLALIGDQGKRWDDFLAWAKRINWDVHDAAAGLALDAIPGSVLPALDAYLKLIGAAQDSAETPPPVRTGPPVIPEEDIPF